MKTGFFEESPGQRSWMRLAGSYLLLLAGFIIVMDVLNNKPTDLTLIITLISAAIGGKVAQKISEAKTTDASIG